MLNSGNCTQPKLNVHKTFIRRPLLYVRLRCVHLESDPKQKSKNSFTTQESLAGPLKVPFVK